MTNAEKFGGYGTHTQVKYLVLVHVKKNILIYPEIRF